MSCRCLQYAHPAVPAPSNVVAVTCRCAAWLNGRGACRDARVHVSLPAERTSPLGWRRQTGAASWASARRRDDTTRAARVRSVLCIPMLRAGCRARVVDEGTRLQVVPGRTRPTQAR